VYPEERQQAIAARVTSQGRASVAELAQVYAVTTETVRRDLAVLDRAGVLRRVHGGAVPARALHLVEPSVDQRESTRAGHKQAIAHAAAEFIPQAGSSVLFDAGTTTARLAALLPSDRDLLVVTNSVPIAARSATMGPVSLQLLGGRVRGLTQAAVGGQAVATLESLRIDVAFIGANGITPRHGLSTPDPDEAAVKRAMVGCANFVVVVADSSKVGREDLVSFAPIDAIDVLVTDSELRPADHAVLTERGVEVITARERP
jgi:DeoR family fructose operon transcriptional repressor